MGFLFYFLYINFLGYSGSDMKNLVKDASMGPLREAFQKGIEIANLKSEDMRPVTLQVMVLIHSTHYSKICITHLLYY